MKKKRKGSTACIGDACRRQRGRTGEEKSSRTTTWLYYPCAAPMAFVVYVDDVGESVESFFLLTRIFAQRGLRGNVIVTSKVHPREARVSRLRNVSVRYTSPGWIEKAPHCEIEAGDRKTPITRLAEEAEGVTQGAAVRCADNIRTFRQCLCLLEASVKHFVWIQLGSFSEWTQEELYTVNTLSKEIWCCNDVSASLGRHSLTHPTATVENTTILKTVLQYRQNNATRNGTRVPLAPLGVAENVHVLLQMVLGSKNVRKTSCMIFWDEKTQTVKEASFLSFVLGSAVQIDYHYFN